VPVIVDHSVDPQPFVLSESAAILVYLAEIAGNLLPAAGVARARVFEQLFFHASGISPAFGNAGFFQRFAPEQIPLAIDRFKGEANRLLDLLDAKLAIHAYTAGDSLSIADIAHFGWLWRRSFVGVEFGPREHLARWYKDLEARPAVQRAISRLEALTSAQVAPVAKTN
jgi:glutathione S-transferase